MKKFLSLKRTVATLTPLLLSFPLIAINTNLSYATSLTVSARISEATCAIQVNSGATGVADLGEWVYAKTGTIYSTLPVVGSGATYSAASSTVSIDQNCPVIGMAALSIKFPGSSAAEAENLTVSKKYGDASTIGPTFVITSQDGQYAFPVWAEVSAYASYVGYLRCGIHPEGIKLTHFSGGANGNTPVFIDSDGNTYVSGNITNLQSTSSSKFIILPAGGSTVKANLLQNTGTGAAFSSVVPLASGQEITCLHGQQGTSGGHTNLVTTNQLANLTNFTFRFTGPRQVPLNGWADPAPPPGTEFNGTIILSMSYN